MDTGRHRADMYAWPYMPSIDVCMAVRGCLGATWGR
ncbi:hypothetical protein HaLaN_32649, partial [Haematococcus lacustris]